MDSNETRRYEYRVDLRESPLEEDDRWEFITVKLRLWKSYDSVNKTGPAVRKCDLHRVQVADAYDEPILQVSTCLTDLGFPESSHATMIARLMLCIDIYIINMHRRRHETVFLDIKDKSMDDDTFNKVLRRHSIDTMEGYIEDTRWFLDINRRWPGQADGCLVEAVWYLMNNLTINSNWMRVPWEFDDDLEEAVTESLDEYKPQMVPASEALIIASLEKVQVSDVECETLSCIICMNEDEVGISRMPCTHVFHTECVENWLRISSSCPICRYALPH
ncbi:unnamed protein product [Rhodiola kirilowii]